MTNEIITNETVTENVATEAIAENVTTGEETIAMTTTAKATTTKVGKCTACAKFVSLRKMTTREKANYKRTGLCPKCYAKKQAERLATIAANKAARAEKKANAQAMRANSPFNQVLALVQNSSLNDAQLALLQDRDFVLKATNIVYPLLKKYDVNKTFEEQTYVCKKARYARTPININGDDYLVTNNIYAKNLDKVKAMFQGIGALATDETTTDEAVAIS